MENTDLSGIINVIMENPDLISRIKELAQNGQKNDTDTPQSVATEENATINADETYTNEAITNTTSARRKQLLKAISPYVSKERQKAVQTFIAISDILDMMRSK